jgi:hypothetical protein
MFLCSNRNPSLLNQAPDKSLFHLGKLVATSGALDLINRLKLSPFDFVSRHCQGDWGDLDADDIKANQYALRHGMRLLSSYRINAEDKLWIITEADRSVTTLLLPEDY